ncbi:hypothetical protein NL676_007489 [Syzygium grande]|nr:hypothetical protein NL676_007489 [Syzygium grande]
MTSPVLSEILLLGFTINSTFRRRTHLVQPFSVVFLNWFYGFFLLTRVVLLRAPRSVCVSGTISWTSGSGKHMISNRESAHRSLMRK